ncbi:bifunctional hydroxymethylpyrimidine kinase/phosphomethylpyrimidine kinase [Prevotella ihumii]|uniref:bifunctional hydroxymethylpyrimidine kinase/phosphomethylpyrimidine kinase n=1 Tax=Prevotella ihumii TaxID=1917878 RepID=UPI0009825B1C|nr:bifunctional hydroxymethylpyrimidine kinase/phosphomethylpyrimidine kinase [Prevotella ihumii]
MNYCKTLTIAGSDCSGGAGIQADIKTMSALGCYAASVITSVTAQNTLGLSAIQHVEPNVVAAQLRAVMSDIRPNAIKIGMVNDAQTIRAIADVLGEYEAVPMVVDPIMVATSGSRLMMEEAVEVFVERLFPMATLLTPNIPEAEVLANIRITTEDDVSLAAKHILQLSCKAVLIKGGHLAGIEKVDRLYLPKSSPTFYCNPTVKTRNTHGTGCTLSSAIAAYLARGEQMERAIKRAKDYVTNALKAGADVTIGEGHGAVNHFYEPEKLIKR